MRSSRASRVFFSRFHPPSNIINTTATTTTIRRSAGTGGSGEDANNGDLVDEMNPLHVPLSFLPLLLVLFVLSLHGGASSSSTSNSHGGGGGRLEGSITTSTLYGDTFAPGTTDAGQKQYRTRPAGFGARFDYGEVYPAHLQAIGDDVHLCGGVLHATATTYHDDDGGGGVYDDEEGGRGGLLGGGGTMTSSSSGGRRLHNDTTKYDEHDIHVVPVLPDKNGRHIPGAYILLICHSSTSSLSSPQLIVIHPPPPPST